MEIPVVFIKEQTERAKKAQEEPSERTKQNRKKHCTDSAAYHRNTVTTAKLALTTGMGMWPLLLYRCKDS